MLQYKKKKKKTKVKRFKCEKETQTHKENAGWCLKNGRWQSPMLLWLNVITKQHNKYTQASWEH